MRTHKIQTAALAIAATLLLNACGNSGLGGEENSSIVPGTMIGSENPDKVDIAVESVKTVTGNYDADFELCKNADYVNLDWTSAGKCPVYSVSELYNIKSSDALASSELLPAEMLAKFKDYCHFYFGEYQDEFLFFRPESYDNETLSRAEDVEINGVTYSGYPKISDYQDKLENGSIKINFLVYRNIEKNQYLWWGFAYPHWINKGDALSVLNDSQNKCSSWLPSDMGNPIARYYNDGSNDDVKYNLADGEMSIGEAIKYFSEEYPKTLPFDIKPEYSVKFVDVYKLTNDTYGYLLNTALQYNSVSFELLGEMVTDSSAPLFYATDGQALIVRKNDVDVTVDCDPKTSIEPYGDPILNILSLKQAADTVSEKMTQNVKFNVISTDLVYHGTRNEGNIAYLQPTWEFKLMNANDLMYYNVYVDAVTGECTYFRYSSV